MIMMMNPTPSDRPMDKDKVKEFVHRIVTDMDKVKAKEFPHRKFSDQVKKFVESSAAGLVSGRKSAATSDDDTSSTPGAAILSNDQNYSAATDTEHIINNNIVLDIMVDEALESVLNELKSKIRDFRRRTRDGNIILDDEHSLELKLKNRPSEEIKDSWRLFKIFKSLKLKTGENLKRAAAAAAAAHKNKKKKKKKKKKKEKIDIFSPTQVVDLNEAHHPVNNDFDSDKEDKFHFGGFKEQIDYIHLQVLKRRKLY